MDAKKQTAIEILVDTIFNEVDLKDAILKLAIQQAKAMFKHQIEQAFREGWFDGNNPLIFKIENERYYNETYNK